MKPLVMIAKLTTWPYFLPMYLRTRVIGGDNIKKIKGGCLLVSNHASMYDFAFIYYNLYWKNLYFLANSHLLYMSKLLCWFVRHIGCITISSEDSDVNSFGKISEFIRSGRTVVCFPEGQRNYTDDLLPFKVGAAYIAYISDAPVIPLYLSSAHRFFGRNTFVCGEPVNVRDYVAGDTITREELLKISAVLRERVGQLKSIAQEAED